MDPKSKLAKINLAVDDLRNDIDDFVATGKRHYFDAEKLKEDLEEAGKRGVITLHAALKVLQKHKTAKMIGGANKGLNQFEQDWKNFAGDMADIISTF